MDAQDWNAKYPVGTSVMVLNHASHRLLFTRTASEAVLSAGNPVLTVHGSTGFYPLNEIWMWVQCSSCYFSLLQKDGRLQRCDECGAEGVDLAELAAPLPASDFLFTPMLVE